LLIEDIYSVRVEPEVSKGGVVTYNTHQYSSRAVVTSVGQY